MSFSPFHSTRNPPTFTNGSPTSALIGIFPTPRIAAMSNCSRNFLSLPMSSPRAISRFTSFESSRRRKSIITNAAFFSFESRSVRRMEGNAIFSGMPGKPAPVPMSMSSVPSNFTARFIASESAKCFSADSLSPFIAVRLKRVLFQLSSIDFCTSIRRRARSSSSTPNFFASFFSISVNSISLI